MTDTWVLHVFNRSGALWDRIHGTEQELREQGRRFTMQRGQLSWSCLLFRDGKGVAECRRGVWSDAVKP